MQSSGSNAALRAMQALTDRWNNHEHARDLMSEHFLRQDRRPVTSMPDVDRDGFAEVERTMWSVGARWQANDGRLLATRGDRIAMSQGPVRLGDGDSIIEYIAVLLIDDDGLVERLILFEPEQRADAEAEIDHLAAALGLD